MRFYYDKDLIIEDTPGGNAIIYSGIIKRRVKVNSSVRHLLRTIMSNNGEIDTNAVIKDFRDRFKIAITRADVDEQLKKLQELQILYVSEPEQIAASAKFLKDYSTKPSKLSTAYIHQTMRCNFNCVYCYAKKFQAAKTEELEWNDWLRVLNILKQAGVEKLVFTGGEPLIREDCPALIKEAKTAGFGTTLLTNGALLHNKIDLVMPYVDHVILSLDSADESINKVNRSDKNFSLILETLKQLGADYPEKIAVRTVMTTHNVSLVREFHKFLKAEIGIKKTIKLIFIPNSKEEVPLMPTIAEFRQGTDFELEYKPAASYSCGACNSVMALSPNGDIYPCQNLLHDEFRISNILLPDWKNRLDESKVKKLISEVHVDKKPKCKDCRYRYLCGGGCPAIAYNAYKDMNEHLDFFCEYLKMETRQRLVSDVEPWMEV